jgi:GntR family transcriptional regulator, transcriptional repressor for pyruvate dehydrogenase complex
MQERKGFKRAAPDLDTNPQLDPVLHHLQGVIMKSILAPLKAESLKEVFISRFEDLILTGKLAIGQKLPPERELALQLGVSRPVVHEGLLELAVKGLVTMKPRIGTVVNDYRRQGSLAILESLFNFRRGNLDPELLRSLLEMRIPLEIETTRLAALNRTDEHVSALYEVVAREEAVDLRNIDEVTGLDFDFHHLITLSSGNLIYPLLINSFKPVYTFLTSIFFSDPEVVPVTASFHRRLATAIETRDTGQAIDTMTEMLAHGEQHLIKMVTRMERR